MPRKTVISLFILSWIAFHFLALSSNNRNDKILLALMLMDDICVILFYLIAVAIKNSFTPWK